MQQLGFTRSSYQRDHILHTPDAFVRAALPGMRNGTAIVHTTPATGAAFTQYTVEFSSGGSFQLSLAQSFVYVLDGEITVNKHTLRRDQFAYRPESITSTDGSRAIIIEKPRVGSEPLPDPFIGNERSVTPEPLGGDPTLQVRPLIPADFAFDFAVNTLSFDPGASLPMVEVHSMEHGLLMLDGGGIYRLGNHWYPVTAGDFIWMAAYCPQWFGCIGKSPARYLIYKNWNRHPLSEAGLFPLR